MYMKENQSIFRYDLFLGPEVARRFEVQKNAVSVFDPVNIATLALQATNALSSINPME